MEAKDQQVLEKIYQHICSVLKYCAECTSLDDFQQDSMRVEACVFNLMQIGEPTRTPYEQSKSTINRRFCYTKQMTASITF